MAETTALLSRQRNISKESKSFIKPIVYIITFCIILVIGIFATKTLTNKRIVDGVSNTALIDDESPTSITTDDTFSKYDTYDGYSRIADLTAGEVVKIKHFYGTYLTAWKDTNNYHWVRSSCWTDASSDWVVEVKTSSPCSTMPGGGYLFRNVKYPAYVLSYHDTFDAVFLNCFDPDDIYNECYLDNGQVFLCNYLWDIYGGYQVSGSDTSDYRRRYTRLLNAEINECISFNSGTSCLYNSGNTPIGFSTSCGGSNSRRWTFEVLDGNIIPEDSIKLKPDVSVYNYYGYARISDLAAGDLILIKTLSGSYIDAVNGGGAKVQGTCYYYSNAQLFYLRITSISGKTFYYFENYANSGQYLGILGGDLSLRSQGLFGSDYTYWGAITKYNDEKYYTLLTNKGSSQCIGTYTFSASCDDEFAGSSSCGTNYGGVVFEKIQ